MENRQRSSRGEQQYYTTSSGRRVSRAQYLAYARRRRKQEIRRNVVIAAIALIVVFAGAFGVSKLLSANSNNPDENSVNSIFDITATQKSTDPGTIVMGVNGSEETYVLQGESYIEGGAHAISETEVLTPNIEVSGTVDTSKVGDYTVKYTATDSDGHVASIERTVHVVDSMEKQENGVPILMYHYIYEEANPPEDLNNNYLEVNAFEEQLQYLTENNFYYPSFAEVAAFLKGEHSLPARSICLTFDDGEEGFLSLGVPLAEKYGVPVTSFIIGTDEGATYRIHNYRNRYCMFESHSAGLHQAGGTIGHGGLISALSKDEIVADLNESAAMLGCHNAFAYPFGDFTDDGEAAVAEAGFYVGVTTQNDWAWIGDDVYALNRVRISSSYGLDSYAALIN